ncbi:MAG: hypothetical protein WCG05_05385 [Alphaproteobacteria bacterium]
MTNLRHLLVVVSSLLFSIPVSYGASAQELPDGMVVFSSLGSDGSAIVVPRGPIDKKSLEDLTLPLSDGLGGYSEIVASGLASIGDEKKRAHVASKAKDFIVPSMNPLDRLSVVQMLAFTSSDEERQSVCEGAKKIMQMVPGLFEGEYPRLLLSRLRETPKDKRGAKVDRFLAYIGQCIAKKPKLDQEHKDAFASRVIQFLYTSEDGESREITCTLILIKQGHL